MYAWLSPTRYGLGTDAAKAKGEALLPFERADPLVCSCCSYPGRLRCLSAGLCGCLDPAAIFDSNTMMERGELLVRSEASNPSYPSTQTLP